MHHDSDTGNVWIFHKPIDLECLKRRAVTEVTATARQVVSGTVSAWPAIFVGVVAVLRPASFLMLAILALGFPLLEIPIM